MNITSDIVVEGPALADWIAYAAGCVISGAVITLIVVWVLRGAPVPARLSGRWWLWPLPTSVAAIVRVTRQLHHERRMQPLEAAQEAKTVEMRLPTQRTGGRR